MKLTWTAGLTPEQKERLVADYKVSAGMRERLVELLNKKVNSRRDSIRSLDQYASPSWGLLQADNIGYERALFEVISLICEKDVEK